MWLEVWTKTAANEITVLPTKPSLSAARAGCPLSRHSRASHAAITPQMRALERLSTACAHFPCHTVPPAPCSAIRKAVGVQAARNPSKDTGRMSTSGFGDTTDTWHYVRPADFSTSYQSNVKLLIRGLRPKPTAARSPEASGVPGECRHRLHRRYGVGFPWCRVRGQTVTPLAWARGCLSSGA
jgi:hypothetical protein